MDGGLGVFDLFIGRAGGFGMFTFFGKVGVKGAAIILITPQAARCLLL